MKDKKRWRLSWRVRYQEFDQTKRVINRKLIRNQRNQNHVLALRIDPGFHQTQEVLVHQIE